MAEHSRVESQKIMFHPGWMARWQEGRHSWQKAKAIYPIQVEIAASGACNHRCTFCAMDFIGYQPSFLSKSVLFNTLKEMSKAGVKSVMFGGEGEPTTHPELASIITATKKFGIDVGLTTNGSLMNREFLKKCLKDICWIKISLDAGRKETYRKIHRPRNSDDWDEVLNILKYAVKLKKKENLKCRIGAQMLLLPPALSERGDAIPGNEKEAVILAKKLKTLGLGYFIIKPYSHQPCSLTESYKNIVYKNYSRLESALNKISNENFEIVFRSRSMEKYSAPRNYSRCLAIPFAWAYIMADGSVYSCSAHLLDKRFYLGNLNKQSFKQIWQGEKRKRQWQFMRDFSLEKCRKNCVVERVNEYLWEAVHPTYNVNFI